MEKNKKKKSVEASRKGVKRQTEYKSREAEGAAGKADGQFKKLFGTAKESPRKG